ncbi:MAG: RNA polymerase sigma factor [Candidatus Atribacteria bacterium]|nr:MAG: RNA polymerase sigma factor [Candidatus Atribacteria bacterium]
MIKKYSQFYEEYKNKLFRYLMFRCGDYEVARDIMQESFTRHYQYSGNSTDVSPAFLYTIARNALVDYQRHENKYTLIQDYAPQPSQDLEADIIIREECQAVAEAFNKLLREDREILGLVVSCLPYRKIGKLLGLSEANIKVRVHRARVRLRDMIQKGNN